MLDDSIRTVCVVGTRFAPSLPSAFVIWPPHRCFQHSFPKKSLVEAWALTAIVITGAHFLCSQSFATFRFPSFLLADFHPCCYAYRSLDFRLGQATRTSEQAKGDCFCLYWPISACLFSFEGKRKEGEGKGARKGCRKRSHCIKVSSSPTFCLSFPFLLLFLLHLTNSLLRWQNARQADQESTAGPQRGATCCRCGTIVAVFELTERSFCVCVN